MQNIHAKNVDIQTWKCHYAFVENGNPNGVAQMTFETWMKKVDTAIAATMSGFTSDDIPDFDYYLWFTRNTRPAVVAIKAIKAAREF